MFRGYTVVDARHRDHDRISGRGGSRTMLTSAEMLLYAETASEADGRAGQGPAETDRADMISDPDHGRRRPAGAPESSWSRVKVSIRELCNHRSKAFRKRWLATPASVMLITDSLRCGHALDGARSATCQRQRSKASSAPGDTVARMGAELQMSQLVGAGDDQAALDGSGTKLQEFIGRDHVATPSSAKPSPGR